MFPQEEFESKINLQLWRQYNTNEDELIISK